MEPASGNTVLIIEDERDVVDLLALNLRKARNFHVKVLEIVLAGTANLDNLRRHSDDECRTY